MEVESYARQQYGRRNNIEINGIPNDVKDSSLEGKVVDILTKVGVDVSSDDIEACHRLPIKLGEKPYNCSLHKQKTM